MNAREAIEELCAGWIAQDNQRIAAVFGVDGRFDDPLHERPLIGEADVLDANQSSVDELGDVGIELNWIIGDAERAVAEGRMIATVVADGSRMDFEFVMVAEAAGGRVTRVTEYFDTRPILG